MFPNRNPSFIPSNGVFNSTRNVYSKATRDLLRALMEDSKVTNAHRLKVQKALREYGSLPRFHHLPPPPPPPSRVAPAAQSLDVEPPVELDLGHSKRRLEAIVASGSYDVEPFRSNPKLGNKAKEKERLQDLMAFGEEVAARSIPKPQSPSGSEWKIDRQSELLKEIDQRVDFYVEMKEQGLEKDYKHILTEIAGKVREINCLDEKDPSRRKHHHEGPKN